MQKLDAELGEKQEAGDVEIKAEEETIEDAVPLTKGITIAVQQEIQGSVDFCVVRNDSEDRSMILLSGLRSIFQKVESIDVATSEYA
jgi:protein involved in polysaccharide export with SLBB domain